MNIALIVLAVVAVCAVLLVAARAWALVRRKNIDIIVRANLSRRRERSERTRHIFVSVADHYEPYWHNTDDTAARERVALWRDRYPALVDRFRDNGGNAPRHGFFYPQEEYRPELMAPLAELVRAGYGDVEVHLHHDNDTSAGLREKLKGFAETLHREHGLLRQDPESGRPTYAFIHGNWTLDNSGPGGRDCGVNDELRVLRETGCYADFTYPSAPHPTQPPFINRIYYATDDPERPCSHHRGVDAVYGGRGEGDLLMFTGPLALNWKQRRRGILPAVENGDITPLNPVTRDRVDLWIDTAVSVKGWPSWVFVKPYTHGTQERNSALLLGDGPGGLADLYGDLLARHNDGRHEVVHFSTPWEMFHCVRALESADQEAISAIEEFRYSF